MLTNSNSVIEEDLTVSRVSGIKLPDKDLLLTPDLGLKRQTECKYTTVANVLE